MGSTRLPGKVLADVAGEPVLSHIVRRVQAIEGIAGAVLAIPTTPEDDPIFELARHRQWRCVRGSGEDVLDRYAQAAREVNADHVVRITADSPLLCMREAGRVLRHHLSTGADATHNITALGSGMPVGSACEVFTVAALEVSWKEGQQPHHREHVDEFIFEHPERFRIEKVDAPEALRRPNYRLTLDTPQDLDLVRRLYSALYRPGTLLEVADVVRLLDRRPDLLSINKDVEQKPV
jgi:spore coat polysaccharide biosynthesis protein SpsF